MLHEHPSERDDIARRMSSCCFSFWYSTDADLLLCHASIRARRPSCVQRRFIAQTEVCVRKRQAVMLSREENSMIYTWMQVGAVRCLAHMLERRPARTWRRRYGAQVAECRCLRILPVRASKR